MAGAQSRRREAAEGGVFRPRVSRAIVDAVFEELADVGYGRLSMGSAARRAGVGKAAVYRRWPDKSAMVADLIGGAVRDSLARTPDTGSLHGDLEAILVELRRELSAPRVPRIIAEMIAERSHDSDLAGVLEKTVMGPRREAAATVLRRGIDRGELPRDLDIRLAIDLIIAPLAFRFLITGQPRDDAYLAALLASVEAALPAAVRSTEASGA